MKKSKAISVIVLLATFISFVAKAQDLPRNYVKSDLLASMKQGDKAALLVVHFGSAYPDAREKVLDVMTRQAKDTFGTRMEVREAYAARSIVKRLAVQDVVKQTPMDALKQLREEGFTHIVLQPTFAIEGIEMEVLRQEAEAVMSWFKDVRVGNPLMHDDEDYETIIRLFAHSQLVSGEGAKLFAAHGTYTAANASYSQLGYMAYMLGYDHFYSGTIEGFPSIDDLTAHFNRRQYKSVTIIPCMFVLINSEHNEVSKFWRNKFVEKGFSASIYAKGLGEHPEIRQLIINHITYALNHKRMSAMERKKVYE